jgi:proteasome component ECM29
MALCRTLTNHLIRNLEVGESTTKQGMILLDQAMPFLLRQLDAGAAKEVQEYAITTLLQVVQTSPSKALRPFAPRVLETLVNSLSSLEHESINYLHLNADKYGLTAEKLDQMRVSSINSSPITEAIDRCLESLSSSTKEDDFTTKDAMNRLEGTFKTVIGLPSKIGLSRVLVTLTVRHAIFFRPHAGRFIQLVRRNIFDRNETVSVAYSMSLASHGDHAARQNTILCVRRTFAPRRLGRNHPRNLKSLKRCLSSLCYRILAIRLHRQT